MATRKPTPAAPQHAELSPDQMRKGVRRLQKVIEQLNAFEPDSINQRHGPEQRLLETAIKGELASVFGDGTVEYNRYRRATSLDHGAIVMRSEWAGGGGVDVREAKKYVSEGKLEALQLLAQAIVWLETELEDHPAPTTEPEPPALKILTRRVFVVHGHDHAAKESVARFLTAIGFDPVILSEQANQGRTIIEKIEAHGDVDFAVVLLTPDDMGGPLQGEMKPRARQNVLLELGYFLARLGRPRVCAFTTSDAIELPTDFAGVVWERFDTSQGWKLTLGRELQAAGHSIDWNIAMRP